MNGKNIKQAPTAIPLFLVVKEANAQANKHKKPAIAGSLNGAKLLASNKASY
ncbi:MAG: hypothetical protein VYA60_05145 [Pseudomonadota bacterium]|nr:hypothetical protein [Pseudomonadota bacterium]